MWDDLREIVLDDSAAAAGTSGASHVARRTHGAAARATSHEHGDHGFDSDTHETGLEDEEADEEHDGAENELAPVSYKELPYTHANKLPFIGLVQMLDRIVEQSGPKKKTEFLFNHKFVGQASLREYLKNQSWWPIMRLVLPDIDKERLQYRLQHKNLGKAFISALGWDADKNLNPQAQRLIHYNNPTVAAKVPGARVGDLSTVLEDVLRERCPTSQRGVTVGEVNQFLDRLRDAAASPARLLIKAQADILCEMLRVFDAHQLGWISRIILKEMRSGLKHESVLRSYHPDAQEAFNMHGDLRRLLAELPDASVRHAFHVKLFDPCRPMLSKHPLRLDEVTNGLGDFAIETKLDGERCLVHFDKSEAPPKVKIFSRNAKDVTAIYGRGRNLTLLLAALPALTSGVVDGEMLAFDSTLGDAVKFGSNKTAAKEFLDQETSVRWPLYMAFDLLVADGELLTGQPYVKRRERLERAFRACPNHVELQPFVLVTEADLEVRFKRTMAALDAVMQDNKEGLVLKSAASPYVPGEAGRAKGFWVKVKPDYVNGLSTDLDCVVLGGYLALGRRWVWRGGAGRADADRRLAAGETPDPASFLLGALTCAHARAGNCSGLTRRCRRVAGLAKDPELPDGRPSHFYQFAKVGSGYDTATLAKLRDALRPHMQLTAVTPPPHFSPVFAKKVGAGRDSGARLTPAPSPPRAGRRTQRVVPARKLGHRAGDGPRPRVVRRGGV
jgi:ATP-dependent DNA ligase I